MVEERHRLQGELPLLFRHYVGLFRKNLLLSWRNRRATSLQLFSSFFFFFLIFCIQKAMESRFPASTSYWGAHAPTELVDPPIPPCDDKFFDKTPCFDFIWSGNHITRIRNVVNLILRNNPGYPIPPGKVLSFGTTAEVNAWLLANPMRCLGALHFSEVNASVIGYGVQTKSNPVTKQGEFEVPTFKFQIALQISAEREIARSLSSIGLPVINRDGGRERECGITDIQHELKTMEEVFLDISQESRTRNCCRTLTLSSRESLQARCLFSVIAIPPTVIHILFCESLHTETKRQSAFRWKGKVHGIILDPDEVVAAYPRLHSIPSRKLRTQYYTD